MNYSLDVEVEKVRKDAEDLYGDFYCSEAVVSVIREHFQLDIPEEVIRMASGFPVGIGGKECLCGAVSGGLMAMGLFFGREKPGDEKITKMMELSAELHDWFKANNGKNALCCRIITKGMQLGSPDHIAQCRFLTGLVAGKTAEIVLRELK